MVVDERVQEGVPIRVGAPVGAEVVFQSVEHGYENLDGLLRVHELRGSCREGLAVVDIVRGGEELAGHVADRARDCGQVIAALPEAVVGSLVAENLKVLTLMVYLNEWEDLPA